MSESITETPDQLDGDEFDGEQLDQQPAKPAKPQTLEELLSDLDDDRRKVILEQVSKPRQEAKNLRERLRALEPKAAEYARLEEASKTEQERAQEALSLAQERAASLLHRAARSELKAALAGVVDDPDAIVDDLNLARFVDDDGEVDSDAVDALRAKYARFGGRRAPRPDSSQASAANGKSTPATPQEEFGHFLKAAMQNAARR
jgi:DNA repair exonuclease SbcCD ATPase subunit